MEQETGEVQETEQDQHEQDQADDARVTKANREAATYRRELRAAQAELKKLRESTQTEQERVIAEAERRGASTATAKVAGRLARAELRAAAAGVVDTETLDGFLEYADLSKFLTDDGEPDTKAITAAVKRLGGSTKQTSFDGGARTSADRPNDMNGLIRRAAGVG